MNRDQISSKKNLSNKIESWCNSMGFNLKIPHKSCHGYSKLQTDAWCHIMKHIRPIEELSAIRKNVLINDLKELKDSQNNSLFPLKGVKSRRDLDKFQLYNALYVQLEEKVENVKVLEKQTGNLVNQISAVEKEKEALIKSIKEVRNKITLMEIRLKQLDGFIKSTCKTLERVQDIRNIISYRVDGEQLKSDDAIDIENILAELEALYHSHQLIIDSGVSSDLDFEDSALWDKIYDCMFLPRSRLKMRIIEKLKSNNTIMDEFLKTSTRIRNEQSLPEDLMDEIRGTNIKIFLEKNKVQSGVQNLKREIDNIIKEKCHDVNSKLLGQTNINMNSSKDTDDNKNNLVDSIKIKLNTKCDEIIKNKKYSFIELKINELQKNADFLEFNESTVDQQKKKLKTLNQEIEEKIKIISKYNAVLLDDRYMSITEASKKFSEDAVEKFNQLNLEINRNIFGHGDVSSSNNETPYFVSQMKGCIKNEVELFVKTPLECRLTGENLSIVRPYDILLDKCWITTINNLMYDFKENSFVSSFDEAGNNMDIFKTLEIECERQYLKYKGNIDSSIDSAEKTFKMALEFSQLTENSFSEINEYLLNNPSEYEEFLKNFIEKLKLK